MKLTSKFFDSYGEFNPISYLADNTNPSSINALKIDCNFFTNSVRVRETLNKFDFQPVVITNYILQNSIKVDYLISKCEHCIVDMSSLFNYDGESDSYSDPKIKVFYTSNYNQDELDKVEFALRKFLKKKDKSNLKKVNLLLESDKKLSLVERELKPIKVDIENNYELSFNYDKLIEKLNSNDPGLILFTGRPGTGKSTLIKNFVHTVDKKFIFVPVDMVGILTTPSFLKFAMEEFKDSILVIEDAENCLLDRATSNAANNMTSTLLNITDGLLADLIQLKIIATVNTEDKIDKALLRKGRLLAKVDFQLLPVDKANKVLERLGKKGRVKDPSVLADLYSMDDSNGTEEIKKRTIGFQNN